VCRRRGACTPVRRPRTGPAIPLSLPADLLRRVRVPPQPPPKANRLVREIEHARKRAAQAKPARGGNTVICGRR
jgi:hypothetical protein